MHLLNAEAWCDECGWKTEGRNAMGNAAKHYQKSGHFVMVELYFSQCFGEFKKKPNVVEVDSSPSRG